MTHDKAGTTSASALALLSLGLAGMLVLAGCRDTPQAEADIVAAVRPAEKRVPANVTLTGLAGEISVGQAIVGSIAAARPLHVIVPLHVNAERELEVAYRFEFFDADNQAVGGGSRWRRLRVGPGVDVQIEAHAPKTNAGNWTLTMRTASALNGEPPTPDP